MKTMSVRVSDRLAAQIGAEARKRGVSKAQIVRERLFESYARSSPLAAISDLIGSVDGCPQT
jgi:hypothetical protein